MKKLKHILSLVLCFALVLSCFAGMSAGTVFAAGNTKYSSEEVILHCWNWPVSVIRNQLEEIANAGYTAVQTSPINGIIGNGSNTVDNWYEFYQPTSYTIGNKICTQAEFTSLCSEAHALGLKVIVDVALNHTTDQTGSVSGITKDYHGNGGISDWDDRWQQTQKDITGMPDLNTSNTTLQSQANTLLKNIISAGADGFRFDAAKHIELPSGYEISGCPTSNYWPTVLNGVNDKFSYGEVLAGQNCPLTGYASFMNVTGSAYSDTVRNNITNNVLNASDLSDYKAGLGGNNLVCWVESHDNYKSGNYGMPKYQITRAWAALTAQGLNTLYLARPYGSTTSNWKGSGKTTDGGNGDYFDSEVVGANKFHNACKGAGVNVYNYNNNQLLVIERGSKGICFINTGSSTINVSVSTSMSSKTYKDLAHNSSFTVSGGTLSGSVPPGVYPVASSSSGGTSTSADYYVKGEFNSWGTTNKMTVSGAVATAEINISAGTYKFKINDSDGNWYGNGGTIVDTTTATSSIGWEMDASAGDCTLQASGGTYTFSFNTNTKYLTITKSGSSVTPTTESSSSSTPVSAKYTVKFTNNQGWSSVYLYAWNHSTGAKNAEWPGVKLTDKATNTYGEEQFTASIDNTYDRIIFNNGSGTQTVDITNETRDGSVTGYYPKSQTNGKWEVGTWEVQPATTAAPTAAPTTIAPTTVEPTTEPVEPETQEPTSSEPATVEPTTAAPTEPAENYYVPSDGTPINLAEKIEREAEDTALSGIGNEFRNLQILGVQKKNDTTKNSVRFVTVINNAIVKDAEDYGYIAVGASSKTTARTVVESFTLNNAPARHVFSCLGKSNSVSGDYGKSGVDTKYKYITFAVNNIGDNAVAVMFYVKDKNGNVHYSPYTNSEGEYKSCSTTWGELK